MKCSPKLLLLCFVAAATATSLTGDFGTQEFHIDVVFGIDEMIVTMHKPVNAPANFVETTNLHIFSRRFIAIKNARDRQCYIRYFNESEEHVKGRVDDAEYNNGRMGHIYEERLVLDGILPLRNRTVNVLLGSRIASFCRGNDVFAISLDDIVVLDPEDARSKERGRRSAGVQVAGLCDVVLV